ISGATHGTAIEAGGVANTAHGALSATGTLKSADVDDAPNTFTAVSTPTESVHGFGTFTMTTIDGTPQVVTVTINGTNDAAVISGATTGSVSEDGGTKCDLPTATGTL